MHHLASITQKVCSSFCLVQEIPDDSMFEIETEVTDSSFLTIFQLFGKLENPKISEKIELLTLMEDYPGLYAFLAFLEPIVSSNRIDLRPIEDSYKVILMMNSQS